MLLVWWYTTGLVTLLKQFRDRTSAFAHSMNLDVVSRYLFVPMYGYYDFWSRVISFCVRVVQLFFGGILAVLYIILELVMVICWIALPIIVVGNIIYQLLGRLW